jgi:hypothetical protein
MVLEAASAKRNNAAPELVAMREGDRDRILRRRWVHSHEEDTEEEMVFRPAAFEFPPSRGRRSFELKPDGALLEGRIGPTDRPLETQGYWELDDDRLVLHRGSSQTPRVMRIASVQDDRLTVEK